MAARTQGGSRLPRTPCTLCGESVIWVERRDDKKRVPINPEPREYPAGYFARVNPALVGGSINIVEKVPEDRRWMKDKCYESHFDTCEELLRCRADGIRSFVDCKKRLGK